MRLQLIIQSQGDSSNQTSNQRQQQQRQQNEQNAQQRQSDNVDSFIVTESLVTDAQIRSILEVLIRRHTDQYAPSASVIDSTTDNQVRAVLETLQSRFAAEVDLPPAVTEARNSGDSTVPTNQILQALDFLLDIYAPLPQTNRSTAPLPENRLKQILQYLLRSYTQTRRRVVATLNETEPLMNAYRCISCNRNFITASYRLS
jgi:hypothetical protein